MKFSEDTLKILKNYVTINQSILFKKGNVIASISPSGSIYAKANIEQYIPLDFAIYDLSKFLMCIKMLDDSEIEFQEKRLQIKSGKSTINYTYASEEMVLDERHRKVIYKSVVLPNIDVQFSLTSSMYDSALKAMAVLGTDNLIISGNDGKLELKTMDITNPTSDVYSIEIGETNKEFSITLKNDNLKLLENDYNVSLCFNGVCHFKAPNVEYFITARAE